MQHTNITDAVLHTIGGENPRLRELMGGLIRHLHDFAREVTLTSEELHIGIEFLNSVVAANTPTHNESVLLSDVLGLSSVACGALSYDDEALLGPFWRENAPLTENGDSIVRSDTPGTPLDVRFSAADEDGRPIEDVEVHVWQASPVGLYENQDEAQADMNLRARFRSDAEGRFWFWSIMPAGYPVPTHGPVGGLLHALARHPMRPAHLHVMLHKPGYSTLITQIFVDDDPYLESDAVFGVTPQLVGGYRRVETAHGPGYRLERNFTLVRGEAMLPPPPIA